MAHSHISHQLNTLGNAFRRGASGTPYTRRPEPGIRSQPDPAGVSNHKLLRVSYAVLKYLLALTVAPLAAILAAIVGASAGYPVGSVLAWFYEIVTVIPPEQYVNGSPPGVVFFMRLLELVLAGLAATVAFCMVFLRLAPVKHQIHSIVVLELVALPGIFMAAGYVGRPDDIYRLAVGLSVLAGVTVLVLKWPHRVYLDRVTKHDRRPAEPGLANTLAREGI